MRSPSVIFNFMIAGMALLALAGCTVEKYDPVKDFTKAIEHRKALSESKPNILQTTNNQWLKSRNRVLNVKYDVQSNDSLVNPYKGVVTFTFLVEHTDQVATVDEAKAIVIYPNNIQEFTASLNYVGSEKGWQMTDGAYFFNSDPQYTYPLNPTRITTVSGTPFAQLLDWL